MMRPTTRACVRSTPDRRVTIVLTGVALAVAMSGCGIRDPYAGKSGPPPSSAQGSHLATAAASSAPPPAQPDRSQTNPQAVLDSFSLAYGDVTPTAISGRLQRLISFATPAYAIRLERDEPQAAVEAIRGLPPGAQTVAHVASAWLGRLHRGGQSGTVVLQETIELAGGNTEPAVNVSYKAWLARTNLGWRVAKFTPVQ